MTVIAIDPGTIRHGLAVLDGNHWFYKSITMHLPKNCSLGEFSELLNRHDFIRTLSTNLETWRERPDWCLEGVVERADRRIRKNMRREQKVDGNLRALSSSQKLWRKWLEQLIPEIQVTYINSLTWQERVLNSRNASIIKERKIELAQRLVGRKDVYNHEADAIVIAWHHLHYKVNPIIPVQ